MKSQAVDFLKNVPDEDISDLHGMQTTMNDFLNSMGLPSVSFVPGTEYINAPERRSFDEIKNGLADIFDDS